jgi:hypothetical protein
MDIFMLMICVTTILAVLYGLAWHNEPARQRDQKGSSSGKPAA